jgi:hypothetical protein
MGAKERNLSCPAVSHISNLMILSSIEHIFARKAAILLLVIKKDHLILPPIVASLPSTNVSVTYFVIILDLPTDESPNKTNLTEGV